MGVIVGVVVGYVLGTRAGEDGWSELVDAWRVISSSEEVRDLMSGALSSARDVVRDRGQGLARVVGAAGSNQLRPAA
jgi:hypothetical protein